MHAHVPFQCVTPAERLFADTASELRRQVLLLVRAHVRWIRTCVLASLPVDHHPAD